MRKLVKNVLDNHDEKKVKIKSVLSDGAHDANKNFRFPNDKRIKPAIKVKRNSTISYKSNRMRNKVIQQTKDFLKWKNRKIY